MHCEIKEALVNIELLEPSHMYGKQRSFIGSGKYFMFLASLYCWSGSHSTWFVQGSFHECDASVDMVSEGSSNIMADVDVVMFGVVFIKQTGKAHSPFPDTTSCHTEIFLCFIVFVTHGPCARR